MDLDSNAYYKLCSPDPDRDDRYNKIIKAIHRTPPTTKIGHRSKINFYM